MKQLMKSTVDSHLQKIIRLTARTFALALAFTILAPGIAAGPAAAAPQILGLVASAAPVPLVCDGLECAAEFPAFCLQQERTMPPRGTAYEAGPGTGLTLSFTAPGGARRTLAVAPAAIITAARGYHAVRIAIPESVIAAYGGWRPALTIAPLASAVPLARPEHRRKLEAAEIAHVTGPHRKAVAAALADGDATIAVATMSRLINALPRRTTAETRATLWTRVIGDAPPPDAPAGLHQARGAYGFCKRWADTGRGYGMRDCLRELHDHAGDTITGKAWDAARPGM